VRKQKVAQPMLGAMLNVVDISTRTLLWGQCRAEWRGTPAQRRNFRLVNAGSAITARDAPLEFKSDGDERVDIAKVPMFERTMRKSRP